MGFLGAASRLTLLILSVHFFVRASSAPVRTPTLPPFGPTLAEKREWVFVRVIVYVYPVLQILYISTSFFEYSFIIATHFHSTWLFLNKHLPLPTMPSEAPHPGYTPTLALLIGVLGGYLRVLSFKTLGNAFTFNVTRQSPKLVTTGPYSLVRHPSYLGASLMLAGITLYHLSPGSWLRESGILQKHVWKMALGLWIFITIFVTNICQVLRVQDEDQLMQKMFGKEWEAWRKVVRYKMIPGLY
ncbi:hypothetical protein E1B28_002039 [Marasmius oreades]|uniref:Protein-S-isoprenylcysteine O-methyltransferase n=1 Tax=Marasmius oreades TaxID=181124 RepID=A0A9P7V4L7_9AGAR|nr:uncharacterized protein E1B28_002039 [Marasmius oreades]KAG7100266.1 hypothetical protein E1B28_002039 [Marasmius oreades]